MLINKQMTESNSIEGLQKNPAISEKFQSKKAPERHEILKNLYGMSTMMLSLIQKIQLREITKKAVFKFDQQLFATNIKDLKN